MDERIQALIAAETQGRLNDKGKALLAEIRKSGMLNQPAQDGGFSNSAKAAARTAEFGARGFTDSALETVGAIPDAVASGLRYIGVPAPEKGFYTDKLKQGAKAVGQTLSAPLNAAVDFGPDAPANDLEKGAYGAGRGVADAATVMVPGAALAKSAKAGSVAQGVGKALATAPAVQAGAGGVGGAVTEVTDNPLLGMAASVAVPLGLAALPKVVTPAANTLSGEERRLAAMFEREGGKLTAGQATGSKPLQTVESTFMQLPFTRSSQAGIYDAQRKAFNKMVLGRAGVSADTATPEVLDTAFNRIGTVFDDIARRTTIKVDGTMARDIRQAYQEYSKRLPTDIKPVFKSYVDDLMQAVKAGRKPGVTNVTISGETYKTIASDLRRAARNANKDPDLREALGKLSATLDDAVERSVGKGMKEEWRAARRDYRNLLMIDKAMAMAPQADAAAGNIPFGALKNSVRQSDPGGFARGRGEMNDVSRVGSFLGSTKVPDSGTAARTNLMGLLQGGPGVAGGAGGLALGGSPEAAAIGAGVGLTANLGLPKTAQMMMNSDAGQAYLRNSLLSQTQIPQLSVGPLAGILSANQVGQIKQ